MKFTELDLHPKLLENLEKMNFTECTPIQEQGIPILLQGRDVAGLAQTGTGKTAAFLLPVIDRILRSIEGQTHQRIFPDWKKKNCLLVLVPTRELADQVYENAQTILMGTDLRAVSIYGGTTYDKQKSALAGGVEVVIATPGRLIDLYKEHHFDMGQVRAIVFDEADRMFDMGFKDDMKFILRRVPRERQFIVFSATLNFDVLNVAYEFGADPVEINISRDQAKAEHVKDMIFHVGHTDKPAHLLALLKREEPRQTIIFSNFKRNVERIALFLNKNGRPAMGISSLLTQAQRTRVMTQFKEENDSNILIATDLAARGLDILGVDMVINFELPDDPENYVHRIGRTGRAGKEGKAFSFVSDRDVEALARIESFLKHKVDASWMDDKDIPKEFVRFPSEDEASGGSRPARFDKRDRGPRDGRRPGGGGGGRGPRHDSNRRPDRDRSHDRAANRNDRGPRDGNRENREPREHRDGQRETQPRAHQQHRRGGQQQQQSQGQAQGQNQGQGNSAHRDRRTGRHGDQQQRPQRSDQPRRHGQGGHQPRRHGNGHPKAGHSTTHRRSGGAQASKAGLGSKVSGFIKSLFGKKPAKNSTRNS